MPNPIIAAGAISGATSLVGSGVNALSQYYTNEQAFKRNKELAELAYKHNLDMWQRQTAYNSPSAQIARLRAAGVNPALAFGSGNLSGNAEPAPEMAYTEWNPKAPVFDMSSPISSALSSAQAASSITLQEAQSIKAISESNLAETRKKEIESLLEGHIMALELQNSKSYKELDLLESNIIGSNLSNDLKAEMLSFLPEMRAYQRENFSIQLSMGKKQIEEMNAKIRNLDASTQKYLAEAKAVAEKLSHEIAEIEARIRLLNAQKNLTDEQAKNLREEFTLFAYKRKELAAKIQEIGAKTNLTNKEAYYYTMVHGGPLGNLALAAGGGIGEVIDGYSANPMWSYPTVGYDPVGTNPTP